MKFKITLVLLLISSTVLFAQIGEIAYLEGEVSLVRDEETISSYELDFGDTVENFDLIVTGDGYAEIETYRNTGISSVITVQPHTSFSFEISDMVEEQQGAVNMLAGEIGLKVARLTGRNGLSVRTSSVAMGVRGTEFTVSTSPDGALLVTCNEGSVECTSSAGESFFCEPGSVVSAEESGLLTQIPVAVSSLENFRENWIRERISSLGANIDRSFPDFILRYTDLYIDFRTEFSQLVNANKDLLDEWRLEDQEGRIGNRMDLMQQKRQIIGDLMDVRRVMSTFERVYYRLLQLREYLEDSGTIVIIEPGYSSEDFFDDFDRNARMLTKYMNEYRYIVKLYALRNGGEFPLDTFSSSGGASDDGFFSDSDSFFD